MIAGQSPRMQWRVNPNGVTRTLEEAIEIARRNGVTIPEYVSFSLDGISTDLGGDVFARGPRVDMPAGAIVTWTDLIHDKTGKVPFRIWPGILNSDEAIVAIFAHEMYEIEELRPLLSGEETTIEEFIGLTRPGNPGNIHDEAWEVADKMVERMRGG